VVNVDKKEYFTRVLASHPYYQSTIYRSCGYIKRTTPAGCTTT